MSGTYRFIDHASDIAVEVNGTSLEELFSASAKAWKEVTVGKSLVSLKDGNQINLEQPTSEELLVSFLDELNYLFQTKKWVTGSVEAIWISEEEKIWTLSAKLKGEPFTSAKHKTASEIKAITFHQVNIKKSGIYFQTRILFGI
jgi:SHS2 domain-containing protein